MTFSDFMDSAFLWRDAMLAASLGGLLLAYIGFYIVLTRNAFVSAAISQLAGLGVVLAMLAGYREESVAPLLSGAGLGVAAAGLLALPRNGTRAAPDAILAAVVVASSAATLLLARFLTFDYQHVQSILYGDAVVSSPAELRLVAIVAALVLVVHFLFRDRFLLVIYDPDAAKAQGVRVGGWGLLLGATVGISIAAITRALGALPAFAFSVVPPMAALMLAGRLRTAIFVAAGIAVASASGGYYLSFVNDLPTGPTIVGLCLTSLAPALAVRQFRRR